jgi:hypothetical protein
MTLSAVYAAVCAVYRHESGRWSVWAYAQQEQSRRRVCRIAVIDEPNWPGEAEKARCQAENAEVRDAQVLLPDFCAKV